MRDKFVEKLPQCNHNPVSNSQLDLDLLADVDMLKHTSRTAYIID